MQAAFRRKGGGLDPPSPRESGSLGVPHTRGRRSARKLLRSNLVFIIGGVALVLLRFLLFHFFKRGPSTLVLYVAGFDDPEALNNVNFFFRHAVKENDGASYVLVIKPDFRNDYYDILTNIPHFVEVVTPPSRCYAMGLVGWALQHSHIDVSRYKHFVWLDSSMRGPYLPTYVQDAQIPWYKLLTNRLDDVTKLMGATISCSGVKLNISHPTYFQPHVQTNVMATDSVGIEILLNDPGALQCHNRWLNAVRFSEIGASEAILKAGYNIGSLMLRYMGVDFRDRATWSCNARISPMMPNTYDGYNLHPLEVLFIKTLHHHVVTQHPAVLPVLKYEEWTVENSTDINRNAFRYMSEVYLDDLIAKGPKCFDYELYISAAPVEFEGYDAERAWLHFIMFGYREGRPYRFAC